MALIDQSERWELNSLNVTIKDEVIVNYEIIMIQF